MTSGGETLMHRLPAALFGLLLGYLCTSATAQTAQNADWGIEQLMQSLAQVKSAGGRFVERKYLAILTAPLEFSGILVYTAPNRIEKRILLPKPETMIIEQDRVTLETPSRNQRRTLALGDYPIMRAFVESIRSTLAGDAQTLARFYRISLEGNPDKWRMSLAPIESSMQAVVRQILIGGSQSRINTIEVIEATGDRSVTTITGDVP